MQKIIILSLYILVSSLGFSIDLTKYDRIYNFFKEYPSGSLIALGENYYQKGELDSALVCFSIISGSYSGNTVSKEENLLYAKAYNRCGAIYIQYSSYTKALNMLLKALEICEISNNEEYIPHIYNNIANVYYVFQDYHTAETYCQKAYEIALKHNDKEIQKILLNNMIGINCYMKEYAKAKKHLNLLTSLNPDERLNSGEQSTLNYYYCISNGAIELEQRKYAKALDWFKKSICYTDSCNMPERLKYVSYSNISKVYEYAHQYDSALYYLKLGEKVALTNEYNDLITGCYNSFSDIYKKMGDEQQSLVYKRKYLDIADSIFNTQEFGQIKDMQFLHEMDKIEKQVYRLNDAQLLKDNQIRFQQKILGIIIGAFIIIVILLILMYLQNKKLREANTELFNKNLEIIKSEEDRKKDRKHFTEISASIEPALPESPSGKVIEENKILSPTEIIENKSKYQSSTINEEEKKRIKEAILDIMDNTLEYCSVDFNLEKLSTLVNSKSKYVSQVINECFEKNFNLFTNEYRIKEARRRLTDINTYGNYTIASIATGVGFKSNANFNLIFKKVTGITPSVYQEMARKHQDKLQEISNPITSE